MSSPQTLRTFRTFQTLRTLNHMHILIINGPNLNLLGHREPGIYGAQTFEDFLETLRQAYPDVQIDYFQSNHEGDIIDRIHLAGYGDDANLSNPSNCSNLSNLSYPSPPSPCDGIILNAGAYTHFELFEPLEPFIPLTPLALRRHHPQRRRLHPYLRCHPRCHQGYTHSHHRGTHL